MQDMTWGDGFSVQHFEEASNSIQNEGKNSFLFIFSEQDIEIGYRFVLT